MPRSIFIKKPDQVFAMKAWIARHRPEAWHCHIAQRKDAQQQHYHAEVKLADRAQRLCGRANHAGETAGTDAERQARLLCPTPKHSGVVPGQKRLPHALSEDQVRQLINGNEIIA
jgi:hypothetical protein